MSAKDWATARPVHRVRDRPGLLEAINTILCLEGVTFAWHGHASKNWALGPAAYRRPPVKPGDTILGEQEELLREVRLLEYDRMHGIPQNDLALLALLQHNGAATLLLDVTTDPFVALYFACLRAPRGEDGRLIAIDVTDGVARHFDINERGDLGVAMGSLGSNLGLYRPPRISGRFTAQRGRFIFGEVANLGYSTLPIRLEGWNKAALHRVFDPNVPPEDRPKPAVAVSILIDHRMKAGMLTFLDLSLGLSASSMFPDLPGFAQAHGFAPGDCAD
jgi:hypothetical protein